MASAIEHTGVVSDYLQQEVSLNRMVVIRSHTSSIHKRFWGNPKESQTRQMAPDSGLIVPMNASVNDGIDRDMCSISYTSQLTKLWM